MSCFTSRSLAVERTLSDLIESVHFEDITAGRKGAILSSDSNIVRTTTRYDLPVQSFQPIHYQLMREIGFDYNNALIETYSNEYRSMGYHSDQALDLSEDSSICLYTCYSNPETKDLRRLRVKNKVTLEQSDITLHHNSIVTFSLRTNREYLHKIILENSSSDDTWLGITFRKSKTFVTFINELPFIDGKRLVIADEERRKEFYKLRSLENSSVDFIYPEVTYTISPGDMMGRM